MGLFDTFLQKATPAGWAGFYDDTSIDYNDMFSQQLALYQQEQNRRNKKFEANEVINSNLAGTTLLTGGSRPIGGPGVTGTDFSKLQTEYDALLAETDLGEAYSGSNLTGLSGDSLDAQKRANAQRQQEFADQLRKDMRNLDYSNMIFRV